MSWTRDSKRSRLHDFCARVLRTGPIPHHVAIIMDGNRRFASKHNYERAQGHLLGFDKLTESLEWCLDMGINEVTVFAFSIENFNRSKEEVDGLMELARQKCLRLVQEKEMLMKQGVRVCVLGDISLLPQDLQERIAEGIEMTKNNDRAILNICFAYTSRNEICHAMKDIAEGVSRHMIRESDISESLIERCLYSGKSRPPDLLIRTSGEVRLSDFLLWQTSYSVLSFVNVLWPEFSRWHFYAAILHYQTNAAAVEAAKAENLERLRQLEIMSDTCCVQHEMDVSEKADSDLSFADRLAKYQRDREARIAAFLDFLDRRNAEEIADILKSHPSFQSENQMTTSVS